jgi:dTDP-4-dehydrorhamnose 3,5-epimerase-like enzyme
MRFDPSSDEFEMAAVEDLSVSSLQTFRDERGELVPIEMDRDIPFQVVRLFWVRNVPKGKTRAGHAHIACHQYLCCVGGSVTIEAFDGVAVRSITLEAGTAVHIRPKIFTTLHFEGAEATILVLCDRPYEASDYLDRQSFLALVRDEK